MQPAPLRCHASPEAGTVMRRWIIRIVILLTVVAAKPGALTAARTDDLPLSPGPSDCLRDGATGRTAARRHGPRRGQRSQESPDPENGMTP